MLDLFSLGPRGWGDELLSGTVVTIAVSVLGFILGCALGLATAVASLSRRLAPRWVADVYTTIVRGVPSLLVIYLFFFGSSGAIMFFARMFGYTGFLSLDAFSVGVLALAVLTGAYSAEVFRGALQAVPRGQMEAGRAVGLSDGQVFRHVRLPQALRLALPGLGNVWQLVLKDSALVSVTALAELMRMTSVAARSTGQPFTFYVAAGVLYLLLTTVSTLLFVRAERRVGRHLAGVRS
jgi:octopine/nopaline transport system permease protein